MCLPQIVLFILKLYLFIVYVFVNLVDGVLYLDLSTRSMLGLGSSDKSKSNKFFRS